MSKYKPLSEFLTQQPSDDWDTTFSKVEEILGFRLPKSARIYRPWWGNGGANSGHSHAMAWTKMGWKTSKVDISSETLTFVKADKQNSSPLNNYTSTDNARLTVQDKIQLFLEEHAEGATNKRISDALERSPSHIYQETNLMEHKGLLTATRIGNAKKYSLVRSSQIEHTIPTNITEFVKKTRTDEYSPQDFELDARIFMSKRLGVDLSEQMVSGVPKKFDLVSSDGNIVGDAKYYSMVRGRYLPPAKFATIAEYVWLLEKTNAITKFMIFGNDRRVPVEWLKRYGNLVDNITFYFLDADNKLEQIQ